MQSLPTMLLAVVVLVAAVAPGRAGTPPLACAAGASCEGAPVGYEPAYPAGGEYDVFIGPVQGVHILDADGDGDFDDETCEPDRQAALAEVASTLSILVALGTACELLPSGPNVACVTPPLVPTPGPQEFCHMPLAAVATALEVDSIYVTRCQMQDRFVQGAEAEAAYENSKLLLARDLEEHLRACDDLLGLYLPRRVGGRLEEVHAFVTLRLAQYEALDAQSPEDLSADIAKARKRLDGETWRAREEWREAFRGYCDAYRELRLVSP